MIDNFTLIALILKFQPDPESLDYGMLGSCRTLKIVAILVML